MSEPEKSAIPCPRCETTLIAGHLRDPVNTIFVESLCSPERSLLKAWICPECGHVELQAIHPEGLAHQDLSDEDLGLTLEEQRDWADWEEGL